MKRVYDINLNSLGVRSQESGEKKQDERGENHSSRRRKFFVSALIRIGYHTFIQQRPIILSPIQSVLS